MKSLHWLAALCCGVGALQAPAALAECLLDAPAMLMLGRYDPGAAQALPVSWQLTVKPRHPKAGCRARLQAEATDQAGHLLLLGNDPAGLRVALAQDASGRQALAVAPQDLASFQLEPDQQTQLVLWAVRSPGQWIDPGLYRASLHLSLLDEQGRTLERREVDFQSIVPPLVQAQFGQVSSAAGISLTRLDFGELRQGASRRATLSVQANTGYTITLGSANSGRLVHSSQSREQIGYQLRLDGRPVALNQSLAGLSAIRSGRQQHEIEVEIGPMQQVLAGEYRDSLLITISGQ